LQNGVFSGSSCKIEISQELYSAAAHAGGTARIHSEKRHCNPVDAAAKNGIATQWMLQRKTALQPSGCCEQVAA